ncbi:MAG: phosphomannomutase/phosphoglucomutase [Bacteroidota bacterium]
MGAFKAYDIRGIYNTDFNKEDVYRIGFFLPDLLKTNKILVGRDVRVSSPEVYESLARGINDGGADVYYIGLSTTPFVYWATAKFNFDASVMITASHNSKEYNGLKISRTNALPVGYDSGLDKLEKLIKEHPVVPKSVKGKIIDFDKRNEYLDFLKAYVPDISGLKLSIDCSNGMASLFIKDLIGESPSYLFFDLDGTFPNHEANPLVPENVADLKKHVLENKSDLGIVFDGDADRVMFIDEKGVFISPDLIIGVLAHYYLEKEKGNVLQDIRTSKAVGEYIEKFGSTMHMWRVGRAYASPKLREINGIFGGEFAGHYYFRDFYYSDSGLLACLLVLDVVAKMKKDGVTVSELINRISSYSNSGEINFRLERKREAMEAMREFFSAEETPEAFYDFDGYRIDFKDWWFNIRMSNTEPFLRFLAEATSQELLEEKIAAARKIISRFE